MCTTNYQGIISHFMQRGSNKIGEVMIISLVGQKETDQTVSFHGTEW
jgi:hypothetical protein